MTTGTRLGNTLAAQLFLSLGVHQLIEGLAAHHFILDQDILHDVDGEFLDDNLDDDLASLEALPINKDCNQGVII